MSTQPYSKKAFQEATQKARRKPAVNSKASKTVKVDPELTQTNPYRVELLLGSREGFGAWNRQDATHGRSRDVYLPGKPSTFKSQNRLYAAC